MMITDFSIKYIQHSQLTNEMVEKIIKIKNQYWPYPEESQKKWLEVNLNDDDYHLCLENNDGQLLGYLNIVHFEIMLDEIKQEVEGVGNVSVHKSMAGQGIGLMLMQICNYYISVQKRKGILLCKKQLVDFYKKAGWSEFIGRVLLNNTSYDKSVMSYKLPEGRTLFLERTF